MNSSSSPIFICAHSRSGTTSLQKSLEQHASISNFGEILHHNNSDVVESWEEVDFFRFLTKRIKDLKDYKPTWDFNTQLMDDYLKSMSELCQTEYFLIDIKYNSWHLLNPLWHQVLTRPFLLSYLNKRNYPLIHIVRNNTVAQVMSVFMGHQTKKWHHKNNDDKLKTSFTVDKQKFLKRVNLSLRQKEKFRSWLNTYKNAFEFSYEKLFENESIHPDFLGKLSELTNINFHENIYFTNRKYKIDYLNSIENLDEIQRFLSSTPHIKAFNEFISIANDKK